MGEGGLDGISKLNWHLPEIFRKRIPPLLLSSCLASSNRNFAIAKLTLCFLRSVFDVHCGSMGFSNSLKLSRGMRGSFSERRHSVVERSQVLESCQPGFSWRNDSTPLASGSSLVKYLTILL